MKHPAPWGTSPDISQHRFWRPGRVRTSTGARLLEVHQVSRQRREKASQKSGQQRPGGSASWGYPARRKGKRETNETACQSDSEFCDPACDDT